MNQTISGAALAATANAANSVEEAIVSRKSVRRFLPRALSRETVEQLLRVASRAPSGVNSQPWRVYVLAGEQQQKLSALLVEAHFNAPDEHRTEIKYSPDRLL